MSQGEVWILDDDEQRATGLCSLLTSIDYTPQRVHKDAPPAGEPVLALLGDQPEDEPGLCARLEALGPQSQVPVFLLGSRPRGQLCAPLSEAISGCIPEPLRLLDLMQALQTARQQAGGAGNSPQARSLARSLVGVSVAVQRMRNAIARVAPTDATVLITGETGTGKEVVANSIHRFSRRAGRPFVAVNCGAIPAELLESELFGHEKGAFTGAVTARKGRFELAEGGTLFLDEIGDMPQMMQVKLLRVLQESRFERVGSEQSREADVRVIAATHRNLEARITEGQFREDLYYRLNVFPVEAPPLRERLDDLPLLVAELLARQQGSTGTYITLGSDTLRALAQYHWPGNVRELANLLERLAILYPAQEISVAHLPQRLLDALGIEITEPPPEERQFELSELPATHLPEEGVDLKAHLATVERSLIEQALQRAGGVVAHAARLLGMRRTTLVEKMRRHGLSADAGDLDAGVGTEF